MNSQEMNMTAMHPSIDDGKYKASGEWDLVGQQSLSLQSTPSVVCLSYSQEIGWELERL